MILSPKARFQITEDAKSVGNYIHSAAFLNAVTAALAEMQMNLPGTGNPSLAWDCHCQMTGAKTFLTTLINICDPVSAPKVPDMKQNLQATGPISKKSNLNP